MRSFLAAAALLAFAAAALAQTYKWVDEKGRVHYGDKPPPGARPSPVKPPTGGPAEPPPRDDLKASEREFRRRQIERGQREAAEERQAKLREAQCARAKERLVLAERARLFRVEKGERVFLSDAEQQAEVARRSAEVQSTCR